MVDTVVMSLTAGGVTDTVLVSCTSVVVSISTSSWVLGSGVVVVVDVVVGTGVVVVVVGTVVVSSGIGSTNAARLW